MALPSRTPFSDHLTTACNSLALADQRLGIKRRDRARVVFCSLLSAMRSQAVRAQAPAGRQWPTGANTALAWPRRQRLAVEIMGHAKVAANAKLAAAAGAAALPRRRAAALPRRWWRCSAGASGIAALLAPAAWDALPELLVLQPRLQPPPPLSRYARVCCTRDAASTQAAGTHLNTRPYLGPRALTCSPALSPATCIPYLVM